MTFVTFPSSLHPAFSPQRQNIDFVWNVNDLKTREEVLQWYLELNQSGTPHTKQELVKVQAMLVEAKSHPYYKG